MKADVALLRLPAPGLRGTFAKAYHLLTLLASKIGWDELLKTRSQVFVMEEEYRLHKTHASVDLNLNGNHDASSITGVKSPAPSNVDAEDAGTEPPSAIPTIRISTESARTPSASATNGSFPDAPEAVTASEAAQSDQAGDEAEPEPVLEKPETAHEKEDGSGSAGVISGEGDEAVSAFSNKRLCERWLGEPITREKDKPADEQITCSCKLSFHDGDRWYMILVHVADTLACRVLYEVNRPGYATL